MKETIPGHGSTAPQAPRNNHGSTGAAVPRTNHERAVHKATIFVAVMFALVAISLGVIVFVRNNPQHTHNRATELLPSTLLRLVHGNERQGAPYTAGDSVDLMRDLMTGDADDAADPYLDHTGGNTPLGAENSLVPLGADEMLLASLMVDTDGDALPDQVLAVARGGQVMIVFVRYDSASNLYARAVQSPLGTLSSLGDSDKTVQNVSLSAMDMTGDHNMEIVCHGNAPRPIGDTDAGQKAVTVVFATGKNIGKKIGDFRADSVYTETSDRTAAYNLSQAAGEPFHVWTYNEQKGGDETRTEWNYSAKDGQYVVIKEQHIAASDIKEREMSHIKSSLTSFSTFLNGLWYRTTNTDGERFVYFDKRAKEIIFVYQDNEELYVWGNGSLHGRGAVITTTNAAIRTMRRRCDVSVTAMDEIHIRVTDDVSIVQNDTSAWDGTYRKMTPGSRLPAEAATGSPPQ